MMGSGGLPLASSSADTSFTNYPVAPAFDWQPIIMLAAVAGVAIAAIVFLGKVLK